MYTKILGLLAGALVLGVSLGGCEQPQISCRVAGGGFAMKYTLKSGSGACAELPGEVVGLAGFSGLGETSEGGPDLSIKRVAIQSESVGNRYYEMLDAEDQLGEDIISDNANKSLYAIGNFNDTLPTDDSCVATALEPARLAAAALPRRDNLYLDPPVAETCLDGMQNGNETGVDCGGDAPSEEEAACPACTCFDGMLNGDETDVDCGGEGCAAFACPEPEHDISYKWTNLNVHVTGTTPGTALTADLEYSDVGCSATYSVRGLFPAVPCAETAECLIEADPEAGIALGSGVNPALFDSVVCDPDLGLCVLSADPSTLP